MDTFEKKLDILRRIHNGEVCTFNRDLNNSVNDAYYTIRYMVGDPEYYTLSNPREQEIEAEIEKLNAELEALRK